MISFINLSGNQIFVKFVCYSESVFGIVMVLFVGGWSDKNRRRKPCMLIPMLGEFAGYIGIS